jgi:hypothetical protein
VKTFFCVCVIFAVLMLKKKWDYGVLQSGKVICRPCDKKGFGEDEA